MNQVTTLTRQMAPTFGMQPAAATAYLKPMREAFVLDVADIKTGTLMSGALLSSSPANCVGFVKALLALHYVAPDDAKKRDGYEGGNPLEALAVHLRRDPHETLRDRIKFMVMTNPTEVEIHASAADIELVTARFVSPVERAARSDVRGAKILGAAGIASIALALRNVAAGAMRSSSLRGFELQVLQ